mmetsp:Transcript_16937/g.34861  ORF Transcript_16937/g.34861 Transcript_16937/m.34861 type:complete len:362 (+) Transcript_16937:125-1210(+)
MPGSSSSSRDSSQSPTPPIAKSIQTHPGPKRKVATNPSLSATAQTSSVLMSPAELSLQKTMNRCVCFAKTIIKILKCLLVIPPIVLGFPWLYIAAFFVERKPKVDYSWSEVGWRVFGGFSFSINATIIFFSLCVLDLFGMQQRQNIEDYFMGTVVFMCGYCGMLTFLCICQALWGRYYEEKEEGGGVEAVKYFWRKVLKIVHIDLKENDDSVNSSWIWSFSLISSVVGVLVYTIFDLVQQGLSQHPVSGNCVAMTEVADDGSMCGDGVVYAMQGEEPVCCTITIHQLEFVDYAEGAGAVFFFFYAILESFAALFVWGENATLDDDGDDTSHGNKQIHDSSSDSSVHNSVRSSNGSTSAINP